MFGDYVIILKRTDHDGHSETFVEEYNDKAQAEKAFHHLFDANVDMPEEFRDVDVLMIRPDSTVSQLDNTVVKNTMRV